MARPTDVELVEERIGPGQMVRNDAHRALDLGDHLTGIGRDLLRPVLYIVARTHERLGQVVRVVDPHHPGQAPIVTVPMFDDLRIIAPR
jgi:hypothetical protein